MGLMDSLISALKISDENGDEYMDEDYLDEEDVIEEKPLSLTKASEHTGEAKKPAISRITPVKQKRVANSGMEVCVIKPTSVEEAREITETLLANRTVVLNMEGLDVDIAQRIIDITSGSCYAIDGNLQKISHYIYIITPASVDISGDFQEIFNGSFDVPSF